MIANRDAFCISASMPIDASGNAPHRELAALQNPASQNFLKETHLCCDIVKQSGVW
jgi:hypothetical protein